VASSRKSSFSTISLKKKSLKAIMERLTWLVKGVKAGDRLLFHFSGHGSQVRDTGSPIKGLGDDEKLQTEDYL
jgi:hypothetical protein